MALSLALIYCDHCRPEFNQIRQRLSYVVVAMHGIVNVPHQIRDGLGWYFSSRKQLAADLEKLQQENLRLAVKLEKFQALEKENSALRELLHSTEEIKERSVVAEIVAIDTNSFTHRAVVNKGTLQGIFKGQVVLDSKGIMGVVVETNDKSSNILLVTDARAAIPVQNIRNNLRSIVSGTGKNGKLALLHVTDTLDFKVGDRLMSSGLGGQFPAGYPVGEIISIMHEPGKPFASVSVKPCADLNSSRQVLLLWPQEQS